MSKKTVLATDVKHKGSSIFTDSGEIRASNNSEALMMIAEAMKEMASGKLLLTEEEASIREKTAKTQTQRREVLAACLADKSLETAQKVGAEMAAAINESVQRNGFTRSLAKYDEVNQGERPEVYAQDKNVIAAVLTGPTEARLQVVRDNIVMPPEVDITARLVIEARSINTTREDLLNRKYNEGVEQIMVQEDRLWKSGADALIEANNQESSHSGALTVGVIENGISMITGYNLPLESILFASNVWTEFITSKEFSDMVDPVTRLEILRTGRFGSLYGAALLTDGTREPRQKVLTAGDIYYVSSLDYHGQYTDRGGVQALSLTAAETGINGLGWHMVEYFSLALTNFRSVSKTSVT